MNWIRSKKLALVLILSIIFQGFPNLAPGEFSMEMGEFIENVTTAYAEDPSGTPTPTPPVYLAHGNEIMKDGAVFEITENLKPDDFNFGIGANDKGWLSGKKAVWSSSRTDILQVTPDSSNLNATIAAIAPGYSKLTAKIEQYELALWVHVPLSLASTNNNSQINIEYDGQWGMLSQSEGETAATKTIQLSTEEGDGFLTHYLPIFEHVSYKSGINSISDVGEGGYENVFAENFRMDSVWEWSSSNEDVVKVNAETGLITAVGAGYARVTVRTNTINQNRERDEVKFDVLVTPSVNEALTSTLGVTTGPQGEVKLEDGIYYLSDSDEVTFRINAAVADNLKWELYRDGQNLDIPQNDYMTANISKAGNEVSLSNVQAGTYLLMAWLTDQDGQTNVNANSLAIHLVANPSVIDKNKSEVTWKEDGKRKYYLLNPDANSITFTTNAVSDDSLVWNLYRCTGVNNRIPMPSDCIAVRELGKVITLSDMKAGVYELEANPVGNGMPLTITVVVPVRISEDRIAMNKGNTYDLFSNTNIWDGKSRFPDEKFTLKDSNNSTVTSFAVIDKGILTAKSNGEGKIEFSYDGSLDFPGFESGDNGLYKSMYSIPLTITEELDIDDRPWPEDPGVAFFITCNSQEVVKEIDMSKFSKPIDIGVGNRSGIWPSNVDIKMEPSNPSIIKLEKTNSPYIYRATALAPGRTELVVTIEYGKNTSHEFRKVITCEVIVPLELATTSEKNQVNCEYSNYYGMIAELDATETARHKTIQLSLKEGTRLLTHYLPMFKYLDYADGINSFTNVGETGVNVFKNDIHMDWVWEMNPDDSDIIHIDEETGFITALRAGCATVKVRLGEDESDARLSVEFRVLVTPEVEEVDGAKWNGEEEYYLAESPSITFKMLAKYADRLDLILSRDNTPDKELDQYVKMEISKEDGRITLSDMVAGVYNLVVRPTKEFTVTNKKIHNLTIRIVVPLMVPEDEIIMNVGDKYKWTSLLNILSPEDLFYPGITDLKENSVEGLGEFEGSYLKALKKGEGLLKLYKKDNVTSNGIYEDEYKIPLTIIDKLSISVENKIYVNSGAHRVKLLSPYNEFATVTWTSDDPTVLTIAPDSTNGVAWITPVGPGRTLIHATQTIDGVIKEAFFEIEVVPEVPKVTLISDKDSLVPKETCFVRTSNDELVRWASSDSNIISIPHENYTSYVEVTAKNVGSAVIMAMNEENIVVGSYLLTVRLPIKSIVLSHTNVTIPLTTKTFQLQATITPEEASNEKLVWEVVDGKDVVSIDKNGLVTLRRAGRATISCSPADTERNKDVKTVYCGITVTQSAPVKSIKLDQTTMNLAVGESKPLTYVLTPTNPDNSAVTCTSTNASVATAKINGSIISVTGRSVGQAVIIVRTVDGGYIATCVVTVEQAPTAVKLDVNALTLNVGDYYSLEPVITPANSTIVALSWESSDTKVAIVSNKGKVTAKSPGMAIILVRTKNGASAYCTVTVQQGVTSVKLDTHEETIYIGDEISLDATVSPKSATLTDVKWSSSKTSVARVNADGEVTGVSEGVAIITCTTVDGGYTDYCVITVERPEVEVSEITVNPEEYMLGVGKTYRLTATVTPSDATNQAVNWSSSDTSIVTVDAKGRLRGIAPGTAIITCEAADGSGADAYCEVEVYTQMTDISLNYNYLDMVVGDSETLTAEITPANATYGIYWESEDTSIAVVNRTTGRVTALKAGDTTIIARADDNSGMNTICFVHVKNPVATTNIQVSESELVMIPGETKTVSFTILPAGHTDGYVWSSDNPVVASVDASSGLITAHSMGTANITIFADSGRTASVKIYVVGLSKTTLNLQQYTSTIISLEVFGASRSDLDVRWYSENERIAEVANGKITGRAIGTTYVYAVVNGRNLACRVTVERIRNN